MPKAGVFLDRTGLRYSRLTVIGLSDRIERQTNGCYKRFWNCRCDCGKEVEVCSGNLTGHTQSCGCLQLERIGEALYKHGAGETSEYRTWSAMRRRCYDKNDKGYKNYGGRGISVCDRWNSSFVNFFSDMGERPKGLSLERVDNNGNYCPENCKWGTKLEQIRNRRTTRRLEVNGENLTVEEWSKKTGLEYDTIIKRISYGWSAVDAVTKPSRQQPRI